MKTIGIILKPSTIPQFKPFIQRFHTHLQKAKAKVLYLSQESERLASMGLQDSAYQLVDEGTLFSKSEIIFSLGGDGTMIGTCRQAASSCASIVGVNLGHLGFTTEYTRDEIFEDLEAILAGNYSSGALPLFKVTIEEDQIVISEKLFLNDAVLAKRDIARMFAMTVRNDRETIYKLIGDGLIISSPIGSTAYSMAAGGPILHRDVCGMVLTPICPHSLTKRPMVLPHEMEIIIEPQKAEGSLSLTLDGQELYTISHKSRIKVVSANKSVNIVTNPRRGFFQTLNDKFANSPRDI